MMSGLSPAQSTEGRSVLITGAGARVGREIALGLARAGWTVCVHYNTSAEAANRVVEDIRAMGGHAVGVQADLADPAAVEGLIPSCMDALGRPLDGLVNNASTFVDDAVTDMTQDGWRFHMDANLRAPCFLAQSFANALPEDRPGAIVNLVDQRVKKPTPQFFTYGLSKAGLAWATVTMAQALAPRIRVNAVGPGPTLRNPRQDEASWQAQLNATLLETGSPPDQIVDAVAYLLNATAVTGQVLLVDGGQHLAWKTADVWGIRE